MKEKKDLNIAIGGNLKKARKNAGVSQVVLARKLGVSNQYISDVERGRVGLSINSLISICKILNISSDSILFDQNTTVKTNYFLMKKIEQLGEKEQKIVEKMIELLES